MEPTFQRRRRDDIRPEDGIPRFRGVLHGCMVGDRLIQVLGEC